MRAHRRLRSVWEIEFLLREQAIFVLQVFAQWVPTHEISNIVRKEKETSWFRV